MAQFSHLLGHIEPIAHEDTRSAWTLAQVSKKSETVDLPLKNGPQRGSTSVPSLRPPRQLGGISANYLTVATSERDTDQTAKPPATIWATYGFALSPLDSALQALPRKRTVRAYRTGGGRAFTDLRVRLTEDTTGAVADKREGHRRTAKAVPPHWTTPHIPKHPS